MTKKQIEKELNKQAVQFEEECKNGLSEVQQKLHLLNSVLLILKLKRIAFHLRRTKCMKEFSNSLLFLLSDI